MKRCLEETTHRRMIQMNYNKKHNTIPKSVISRDTKSIFDQLQQPKISKEYFNIGRKQNANKRNKNINNSSQITESILISEIDENQGMLRNMNRNNNNEFSINISNNNTMSDVEDELDPKHTERLTELAIKIPEDIGVYMWKNKDGDMLYIGKANNLRARVMSYLSQSTTHLSSSRRMALLKTATNIDYILTPGSERDALLLEANMINTYQPLYNVLLKDDRTFTYICYINKITNYSKEIITIKNKENNFDIYDNNDHNKQTMQSTFNPRALIASLPCLKVVTGKSFTTNTTTEHCVYFGPFIQSTDAKSLLKLLDNQFHIRKCLFDIKFGSRNIDILQTRIIEYTGIIENCVKILRGQWKDVYTDLMNKGDLPMAEALETSCRQGHLFSYFSGIHSATLEGDSSTRAEISADFHDYLAATESNSDMDVVAVTLRGGSEHWKRQQTGRSNHNKTLLTAVEFHVYVMQLRSGCVIGRHLYPIVIPKPMPLSSSICDVSDYSEAIQKALETHYASNVFHPSRTPSTDDNHEIHSMEILLQYPVLCEESIINLITSKNRCDNPRIISFSNSNNRINKTEECSDGSHAPDDNLMYQKLMKFALANLQAECHKCDEGQDLIDHRLADMQQLLRLPSPPTRIEAYDISHTQGVGTVGSCVVFINGTPTTKYYRTFELDGYNTNIDSKTSGSSSSRTIGTVGTGIDDYACMEEVMYRRFSLKQNKYNKKVEKRMNKNDFPDVVVIDGGVGQLTAALNGIRRANQNILIQYYEENLLDLNDDFNKNQYVHHSDKQYHKLFVCAIAKKYEDIYTVMKHEKDALKIRNIDDRINNGNIGSKEIIFDNNYQNEMFVKMESNKEQPALLLLRAIRDESHRYALKYHRRKRSIMNGLK